MFWGINFSKPKVTVKLIKFSLTSTIHLLKLKSRKNPLFKTNFCIKLNFLNKFIKFHSLIYKKIYKTHITERNSEKVSKKDTLGNLMKKTTDSHFLDKVAG